MTPPRGRFSEAQKGKSMRVHLQRDVDNLKRQILMLRGAFDFRGMSGRSGVRPLNGLLCIMRKELAPAAVTVEGGERKKGLITGETPELTGELEPSLILRAGGFDSA